ncbi:MAG: beta-ketoacyl-ACP synthase III [Myxococcaceae bacterium]
MINAYISGTGMYVPPRSVTNDDLRTVYGIDTTHDWIVQRTGIEARRFAEEGVGSSEMASYAAKQALEDAKLTARDLDMILFATLSPDMCFPGSGPLLQQRLGLLEGDEPKFVPTMDIRNQCSGFVYGLATAASMVRAGGAKHVLVVGAETHSAALDLTTRGRTVATIFGDGAGAVVVSGTEEDRGIRKWFLGADGRYADALKQPIWDIKKRPYIKVNEEGAGVIPPEMLWPQMDGKAVFKNAVERMCGAVVEMCFDQNVTTDQIDLFCFHQANMRINQFVADQLGIPQSKLVHNIHKYGNTTAATIPLLLAEAQRDGKLKRGMKVAIVAFGAGFTWGSMLVDW